MSERSAAFDEIVMGRRSLRAFLAQAVDRQTLEQVFNVAQRAPSNCNTQPWLVHVASGESLKNLRAQMPDRFRAGDLSLDFPYDRKYAGVYRERQHGCAQALYDAVNITRDDKVGRDRQFMRNFVFFDAPHVAFLFLPEPFGLREAADLGMYAQTLMLTMSAHGLGSCPQTALSYHASFIRESLSIDDNNKLLFGISFGYPDTDAPANTCYTDRAALGNAVTFHP